MFRRAHFCAHRVRRNPSLVRQAVGISLASPTLQLRGHAQKRLNALDLLDEAVASDTHLALLNDGERGVKYLDEAPGRISGDETSWAWQTCAGHSGLGNCRGRDNGGLCPPHSRAEVSRCGW